MSIAKDILAAFEEAWTAQEEAWGRRTIVRDRAGTETIVQGVWPTMTERAAGGAGGFALGHDARVAWRRDTKLRPQVGWTVSREGSSRVFEVLEVDDSGDPVTWRVALGSIQ